MDCRTWLFFGFSLGCNELRVNVSPWNSANCSQGHILYLRTPTEMTKCWLDPNHCGDLSNAVVGPKNKSKLRRLNDPPAPTFSHGMRQKDWKVHTPYIRAKKVRCQEVSLHSATLTVPAGWNASQPLGTEQRGKEGSKGNAIRRQGVSWELHPSPPQSLRAVVPHLKVSSPPCFSLSLAAYDTSQFSCP